MTDIVSEKTNFIELTRILNKMVDIFKLQNWDIELYCDRGINGEAQTQFVWSENKATIRINPLRNDEEQNLSLVHELVHIILRDTQEIFDDVTKEKETPPIYNRLIERETEKLAKGIYKLLKEE